MSDYDFTEIAREVAEREDIKNCKIVHKYSSNKGDGYTGFVKAVQLQGSNKNLDVVFKYSHRDPKTHETVPLRKAYLNEINFYKVIVPGFADFQKEYNILEPFNNTPKFYGCITEPLNELLVLEDLRQDNYDLWDRKQTINLSHLEFALKTFAKFHGTSFAMKQLNPKLFQKLSDTVPESLLKFSFKQMKFYDQISKSINELMELFDDKCVEKVKAFNGRIQEEAEKMFDYHDCDVILQGDCWCNNAMYQYEDMKDRSVPKNMMMLDFQIAALGSPAMDLAYFFYSIAPKDCIDNLDYFLKLYHCELGKCLAKFSIKIEDVFSYQKLLEHWKVASKFGLIMSVIIRRAMLTESKDAPDINEDVSQFLDNMKIDPQKQEIYREQMRHLVVHFVERGFL